MMVLSNKSLPSGAADLEGIFHEWQEMGRSSLNDVHDSDRLRRLLIQTMGVTIPDKVLSERAGQNLFLSSLAVNDRLPGVLIPGHGRAALVVDSDGSKSALRGATVAKLRREGRAILVLDVFQTGSSIAVRDESDPMFLTYNIGRRRRSCSGYRYGNYLLRSGQGHCRYFCHWRCWVMGNFCLGSCSMACQLTSGKHARSPLGR